jgi:hypothetical protein
MTAIATVLTEFSDKENNRTYSIAGHTVQAPRLLIQKRKVPATAGAVSESNLQVVYGTTDADGMPLLSKVGMSANVRYPANGQDTDIDAALVVFRDLVASDEFTAMVHSQNYVK